MLVVLGSGATAGTLAVTEPEANASSSVVGQGRGALAAATHSGRSGASSVRSRLKCPHDRNGIVFYRGTYSKWRAVRGLETPYPAGRKPQHCADAHYLAEVWPKRSYQARLVTEKWLEERMLSEQATWIAAIEEAQSVYPGSGPWLRSCSSTEGAGRSLSINYFQLNHQGSGAGGWLQFMRSTFERMFAAAKADAEARGFIVPRSAASWSSRLGQALAGGWAYTHGATGEWYGSGC